MNEDTNAEVQNSELSEFLKFVETRVSEFEQRPLFRLLEEDGTVADISVLVPAFTFFVFAFQDALRLNESRFLDRELAEMANVHRREDAGHEIWFLRDMKKLGISVPVGWVMGKEHQETRDCGYAVVAEALRSSSDLHRIALLFVLESAGDVFFSRAFRFFETAGVTDNLEYFARSHHEIEEGHELLEPAQLKRITDMNCTPQQLLDMKQCVDRTLEAITAMVDDVYSRVVTDRKLRERPSHHQPNTAES